MRCGKVNDNLLALVKGELAGADARAVSDHLETCRQCQAKQTRIQQVLDIIKNQDDFTPSDRIWRVLQTRILLPEAGLKRLSKVTSGDKVTPGNRAEEREEPAIRTERPKPFKWSLALKGLAAVIILTGFLTIALVISKTPSYPEITLIKVTDLKGDVKLDGRPLASGTVISLKGLITSDEGTVSTLSLYHQSQDGAPRKLGALTIKGQTQLQFNTYHYLKLDKGEIYANISPPEKGFKIETNAASISIEGTRFSVKANEKITVVSVKKGAVRFFNQNGSVLIKEGSQSLARLNKRPTNPVPEKIFSLTECYPRATPVIDPILEIVLPKKKFFTNEAVRLRLKITNRDSHLWFTPFVAGSSYLFINVVNPAGKVFHTRLIFLKGQELIPAEFQQAFGLINFPQGETYELIGIANEGFNETGRYRITAVYSATASGPERFKIWKGLIESEPVEIEIDKR